jgi:ribosomal-protein-alanine N-acetyltransferase
LINDEVVGFICYWAVQNEAHLLTVAVHPQHRREGIGKAIMSHMEQLCLKEGLNRIILEVARRNEEARNLYKSLGFNAIGFRKRYYKEIDDDAIVMEKWLGSKGEAESQSGETGPV